MNLALRKIIYDPISYIHPQRVTLNNTPINNPVLRSITNEYMGKIKIVVSDQQPFMIDGIIGFLGHYPDLYEVVGGYKDLKKAIAECNKSTA